MAQTSAATSVLKLYQLVIEDVVGNVREAFLDEGVDEQVLQEMKQIWTNRLMASKAVEATPEPPTPQSQPTLLTNNPKTNGTKAKKVDQKSVGNTMNGNSKTISGVPPLAAASKTFMKKEPNTQAASSSQPSQQNSAPPALQTPVDPNKLIPIQITLPPQQNETNNRVLTIKVPARAIQENTLQQAITGEIIASIMPLQPSVASAVLQQHVTSVLNAKSGIKVSSQVDGTAGDTSDEDGSDISDDHFDDIDDDDMNKDEDASDAEIDATAEEEPLNSEDDVTDEDNTDLFETENVVVCQYDKINRSRNKWKFYLKDGIMSIGGKDYVFQKSNGDAEW